MKGSRINKVIKNFISNVTYVVNGNSLKYGKEFIAILICLLFFISVLSAVPAQCTEKPQPPKPFQYGKNPEIQQIKPKKPIKIKLKRSAKGEYSWDLSGDSADDIIKVDKRLRKMLEIE